MPEWKEAKKDVYGFPMKKDSEMSFEQKMGFLLEEIDALHQRMRSMESTLREVLDRLNKS